MLIILNLSLFFHHFLSFTKSSLIFILKTRMNSEAAAASLMAHGKRHILVHDYNSAVQCLEEACKIYDSIYGVNSEESGDPYLKYGSALIELHRQESGALDGLIDPKQSESDAENDDEEEEDDEELEDEGIFDIFKLNLVFKSFLIQKFR